METNKKISFSIIIIMFGFLFFHRFFIQTLGIPEAIKYILDLLNTVLFILSLFQKRIKNISFIILNSLCYFIMIMTGIISFSLFGGIWDTPLINVIFDLRNIIRFPIFLFSCYNLLDRKQIEKIFHFFIGFHLINCVYIIYQYFTLEVVKFWMRGDNLNGFFGTETGGNQFVNVLMIVTTIIVIDKYVKKEYSKTFTFVFISLNLLISVLIELKFYFVEFALIALYFIVPYAKKLNSKRIIFGAAMLIMIPLVYSILVQMLYRIYPWMDGTMSLSGMLATNTSDNGYTGNGDFNRLNSISGTIKKIFNGDILYSLIGIGFGTANLNGKFAAIYGWTHYSWMSTSYTFVETGFIGFVCYSLSLLLPFFLCRKSNIYMNLSKLGSLLLIALMIYDEALRTEAAYMIFFLVSTGLIAKQECTEGYYKCQRLIKVK